MATVFLCIHRNISDATWTWIRFKSPATRLLVKQPGQADIKKIYKLHITDPFWRESNVTSGFPSQRASNAENFPICHDVTMNISKTDISTSSISKLASLRRQQWHYCPCHLFVSFKSIGILLIMFKFVPFCRTNIGLSEPVFAPLLPIASFTKFL